jgi:predicted DNA repair protein MutK
MRTDFILSAEIIAITLGTVAKRTLGRPRCWWCQLASPW